MDIEKLRKDLLENSDPDGPCIEDDLMQAAATALSTLQAENEKLRETVDKYATAARVIALHLKPFCDESLPYDEMIADAARKASDELEQVKRIPQKRQKKRPCMKMTPFMRKRNVNP